MTPTGVRRVGGGWAIVGIAVLDMRSEPGHRAELLNQLLLGEVVRVLRAGRGGAWLEAQNLEDGYRGWVRSWGLVATTAAGASDWRRRAVGRIGSLLAEAHERPGGGALLTPLFWRSRVVPGARRGTWRSVRLPNGARGWIPARALAKPRAPVGLAERVDQLLGVPYLWGGRTPAGLDCSAFAQLLLGEQGVTLPRDTSQQVVAFPRLASDRDAGPGDLVFFQGRNGVVGHVGVGLGSGRFAHCRGVVRVNSVDPRDPLCDNELAGTDVGWFRPGVRSRRPAGPGRRGRRRRAGDPFWLA